MRAISRSAGLLLLLACVVALPASAQVRRTAWGFVGLGVGETDRDSTALALPIEAHVTWRFTPIVGVSVRAFASVNRLSNFGGMTLGAQVGRLR